MILKTWHSFVQLTKANILDIQDIKKPINVTIRNQNCRSKQSANNNKSQLRLKDIYGRDFISISCMIILLYTMCIIESLSS